MVIAQGVDKLRYKYVGNGSWPTMIGEDISIDILRMNDLELVHSSGIIEIPPMDMAISEKGMSLIATDLLSNIDIRVGRGWKDIHLEWHKNKNNTLELSAPLLDLSKKGSSIFMSGPSPFIRNSTKTLEQLEPLIGKELFSIDGIRIKGLGVVAAKRLLDGYTNTEANLIFIRGDGFVPCSYTRQPMYSQCQ